MCKCSGTIYQTIQCLFISMSMRTKPDSDSDSDDESINVDKNLILGHKIER